MPRAPHSSALLAGRPLAKRSVFSISTSRTRSMPLSSDISTRLTRATGASRPSGCQTIGVGGGEIGQGGGRRRQPLERVGDALEHVESRRWRRVSILARPSLAVLTSIWPWRRFLPELGAALSGRAVGQARRPLRHKAANRPIFTAYAALQLGPCAAIVRANIERRRAPGRKPTAVPSMSRTYRCSLRPPLRKALFAVAAATAAC